MTRNLHRRTFLHHAALAGTSACLATLAVPAPCLAAEELTQAEFEKLHKTLQPPRGELWRTIPWKMEIIDACNQGAREKKPVVMRVRSGHPLGCV
jgi:hypothetical protein